MISRLIRANIGYSALINKSLRSRMSTIEPPNKKIKLVEEMQSIINKGVCLADGSEAPILRPKKPLVWIDCEMTGLDINNDHIIEICCLITDGDLNIVDETGYESTVYYDKTVLDNMNEWCINQHGKSGLTEKILQNPHQTLSKVQQELFDYIKRYIPEERKGVLAGNSIHMDKFFMYREFSDIINHLHYRLVDVSTIMEFGYRHNPNLMKVTPKKIGSHTARSDIIESINQLKWYRNHYFKSPQETQQFVKEQQDKILEEITKESTQKKDE